MVDDWKRKYRDWCETINAEIPSLAAKIFSFRGKDYVGCGFQWSMEKKLGNLIYEINNHCEALKIETPVILEVLYEELKEKIATIEAALGRK